MDDVCGVETAPYVEMGIWVVGVGGDTVYPPLSLGTHAHKCYVQASITKSINPPLQSNEHPRYKAGETPWTLLQGGGLMGGVMPPTSPVDTVDPATMPSSMVSPTPPPHKAGDHGESCGGCLWPLLIPLTGGWEGSPADMSVFYIVVVGVFGWGFGDMEGF